MRLFVFSVDLNLELSFLCFHEPLNIYFMKTYIPFSLPFGQCQARLAPSPFFLYRVSLQVALLCLSSLEVTSVSVAAWRNLVPSLDQYHLD